MLTGVTKQIRGTVTPPIRYIDPQTPNNKTSASAQKKWAQVLSSASIKVTLKGAIMYVL